MTPQAFNERIIDFKRAPRALLFLHPGHVWEHPDKEKERLAAAVTARGNTSVLLVRKHPMREGWEILDGKMRFENLKTDMFWCAVCDLNDAEAEKEVREHNVVGHFSFTTDPEVLVLMEGAQAMQQDVPKPEDLLKEGIKPDGTPVAQSPEPVESAESVKQVKVEEPKKTVKVLLVIPISEWGKVQQHVAALEQCSSVSVQKAGDE